MNSFTAPYAPPVPGRAPLLVSVVPLRARARLPPPPGGWLCGWLLLGLLVGLLIVGAGAALGH